MPRKPIDYSNSSIYKICCRDTDITDCYVGSTTNFRTRKSQHKFRCNNEHDKNGHIKVYQFIRQHGGWENWDMILIEKVNVNDNYELRKEERKWIEELNSTLNCKLPTRTKRQWEIDNKDKIKEQKKEYYENNKEYFLEKHKEYHEVNKEKLAEYHKRWYENNKDKIKDKSIEYRENNKDKIKHYQKQYRKENKDKILEKNKEKAECPFCKSIVSKKGLSRHQQSKKCLETQI